MTRNAFVEAMEELHQAWIENRKYYNELSDIGIITDDPPAFQFLDVTLSILAKEIGDTYGYVQFFVFDMDWGNKKRVYDPNTDTFIDLNGFGELFDYIWERNKQ